MHAVVIQNEYLSIEVKEREKCTKIKLEPDGIPPPSSLVLRPLPDRSGHLAVGRAEIRCRNEAQIRFTVGNGSRCRCVAARRFGIDALKPKQEDAIKALVGGRVMFVCIWLHAYIPLRCCCMCTITFVGLTPRSRCLRSCMIYKHGKDVRYSSS